MIDTPKYPPRGYKPFEIEFQGHEGWVCATPHCDDTDGLCAGMTLETEDGFQHIEFTEYRARRDESLQAPRPLDPPTYFARERIPVLFESEAEAIKACWEHARYWWKGEPPDAVAVPFWHNRLPPGYRIFIEAGQRRMWLVKPDGGRFGEVSGVSLSSAMDVYREQAWEETHEKDVEKQEDDERERVRAWAGDGEPRRWSLQRSDDGDFHPGLPDGHCVEMRIYMPYEMVEDIEAIMRHTQEPRMGVQGHCKRWIEDGIRTCAGEAQLTMEEEDGE